MCQLFYYSSRSPGHVSFVVLQFQGYQDLYLLSKQSAPRRSELFTLSPLGGHPHNWSDISGKCLASLKEFSAQLQQLNATVIDSNGIKTSNGTSGYKVIIGSLSEKNNVRQS